MNNKKYSKLIEFYSTMISLFSIVIWLVYVYMNVTLEWYENLDVFILLCYLVEYVIKVYIAQNRLNYILNGWSIAEIVTIIPLILLQWKETLFIMQLILITRIMRLVRIVKVINRLYKIDQNNVSSVSRQISTIVLTIITLVFVTSGVMLTFEHPNIIRLIQIDLINNCADKKYEEPTFHSMIYFVVVTLATVGYGDITPYS